MFRIHLQPLFLATLMLLVSLAPTEAPAIPSEAEIRVAEARAEADNAQGVTLMDQAFQIRQLAASARRDASTVSDLEMKQFLENLAEDRERRANELEEEAKALFAKAAALQDEIRKMVLQKEKKPDFTPIPSQGAEKPAHSGHLTVHHVTGVWRDEKGEPLVIVPHHPGLEAKRNVLDAHSNRRVWEGHFNEAPSGKQGRVSMTYQPTAREMRPGIPLWARKMVEGEVTWRMELFEEGTVGSPRLRMQVFHPEIIWEGDEEGGTARIEPSDEPFSEAMFMPSNEIRLMALATPFITVRPGPVYPLGDFRGVVWTSPFERLRVFEIAKKTLEDKREAFRYQAITQYAFMAYDFAVGATIMGDIYPLVTGYDHFGHKLSGAEYKMAIVGLISNSLLDASKLAMDVENDAAIRRLQLHNSRQLRHERWSGGRRLSGHEHDANPEVQRPRNIPESVPDMCLDERYWKSD